MTLFDKSFRLALIASAALLTACPEPKDDTGTGAGATDADTDADSDTDTDTDTDSDTDADADTGLAYMYFVGGFESSGGTVTSAEFGYGFYGAIVGDWVCTGKGSMGISDDSPEPGCPDCEWEFQSEGVTGSTAVGDYCEGLGVTDGIADEAGAYGWGYSPAYDYEYNGDIYPLEQVVFLYITDYSWFAFANNYGGSEVVTGNAESLTFARGVYSGGEPVYYYYYL